MLNQKDLIKKVKNYNRFINPDTLSKAYAFAVKAHKNQKNDPRTCDIDILDYNGKIMSFNYKNLNFIIPHEKLTNRNFVLYPLHEILPNWTHPKTKEKVSELIVKLSQEDRKSILKVKKN